MRDLARGEWIMYQPSIETPRWDSITMKEKLYFFKWYKNEYGNNVSIKDVIKLYNDDYGPQEEYFSLDSEHRECYYNKPITEELWKYYQKVKNKAKHILNILRRPEDPFNFADRKTLGFVCARVIEDKEQLKRIITRLRNQYEQLISTIPNSFL